MRIRQWVGWLLDQRIGCQATDWCVAALWALWFGIIADACGAPSWLADVLVVPSAMAVILVVRQLSDP